MLHCITREPYPTIADLRSGYAWWLAASEAERRIYTQSRLQLVRDFAPLSGGEEHYTTGSTGHAKRYLWGPAFDSVYYFVLNDFVRSGSRLFHTAVLALASINPKAETALSVQDTPWHPVIDRWVKVHLGKQSPSGLADVVQGYDVVLAPGHYDLLSRHCDIATYLGHDSLLLFTGESMTPAVADRLGNVRWRNWMRAWDGGATFYTCRFGNKHWLNFLSDIQIDHENRLVSSDYYNLCQEFINYHNGDIVDSRPLGKCMCGHESMKIEFRNRQDVLHFTAPNGTILNYGELVRVLAKSAFSLGINPDSLAAVCFGYAPEELKVDYLIPGGRNADLEEVAGAAFKEFGYKQITFAHELWLSERKVKRLYSLVQPSR